MAASSQVRKDTKEDANRDLEEHSVNNNEEAMLHRLNSTDWHDGTKNSLEKRIATLERELEIKNREIATLQEACKKTGASIEEVQEASDNLAAARTVR